MQLGAFFVFAELFANGFELLAQDLIPLELADRTLDLVLDLGLELQDLDLLAQKEGQQAQPLEHVGRLQQVLLLLQRLIGRRRNQIGQVDRVIGFRHGGRHLGRHRGAGLDVFFVEALD